MFSPPQCICKGKAFYPTANKRIFHNIVLRYSSIFTTSFAISGNILSAWMSGCGWHHFIQFSFLLSSCASSCMERLSGWRSSWFQMVWSSSSSSSSCISWFLMQEKCQKPRIRSYSKRTGATLQLITRKALRFFVYVTYVSQSIDFTILELQFYKFC